jgi:hypothetical protein
VSALLVVLALPKGSPPGEAARLAGVENFAQTAKTRHLIPPDQALEEILPTALDQRTFADNAMKHVADILCDELEGFGSHRNDLPDFFDPYALDDTQTEEYFLPTYDQEQSSTRGHMLVIGHYFVDVLQIPKLFSRIGISSYSGIDLQLLGIVQLKINGQLTALNIELTIYRVLRLSVASCTLS